MKIGVVGPGALGTFLSGVLGSKNEIMLLGKNDIELNQVEVRGMSEIKSKVNYSTDPAVLSDVFYVLLCTKSYDTENSIKMISSHIKDDTCILSLQNGLKNEEIISHYVNKNNVIGGVTTHGITYEKPGLVTHAGVGETLIGSYPTGINERVEEMAGILTDSGIKTEITDNIYGYIWKKVIINAGINPITALTGLKNGAIIDKNYLRSLMKEVCLEAARVAEHEVDVPGGDPVEETEKVAISTAENRSSMLQDVERRRRTEVDCITGAIIDVGEKVGVSTPLNRVLYSLIKGKEDVG